MCEIEDLLRDEIPLRDLVQAAVTATAHGSSCFVVPSLSRV